MKNKPSITKEEDKRNKEISYHERQQHWPLSAKITVWVLSVSVVFSFLTFMVFAYVLPCEECMRKDAEMRCTWPQPKPSCLPVTSLLAERLREQRVKHPDDFPAPKTENDDFLKSILDADDTVEYLESIGY